MTNKEKFMRYVDWRKKQKEYARRALQCDLNNMSIRAVEKTSRRKIGQVTRKK